ncbi:putative transporter [Azospirillum sp. YIM DDC1]|uniref:Transporter n=1 Tax=Azospirillum aestuarii TaxID=2802052 RepID=A0ABS1HVJ0_9PROT|nr:putative transporter [Azospirillum aestuarii]MBK4718699.1 putative transporter [Azospirillum aestuarii]TWA95320.1 putative transport protein [Azospirillum brasilense]
MTVLIDLFNGLPDIARIMLMLSVVAASGLALGQIKVRGVGLGIGGVLFAGIAAGHVAKALGLTFDHHVLHFMREFGLILFVYTIGVQVGPGFFAALKKSGLTLNLLAASLVGLGVLVAVAIHEIGEVPLPAVLGIFSGAVTNTPSLGAAQEMLREVGASAAEINTPSLGYAVAYPFGIVGILITMGLIRVVFRIDPVAEAEAFERKRRAQVETLETLDVAVRNRSAMGLPLRDMELFGDQGVMVSRLLREGRLQVPHPDTCLRTGDVVHLVGPRVKLEATKRLLGEAAEITLTTKGTAMRWDRLVVTNEHVLGKAIGQLDLADAYDVVVSRVNRAGVELVPSPALHLQFGDILTAIGKPSDLQRVAALMGNSARRLQQVEFVPVFIGILLGVLLGSIPFYIPGMPAPLKLGLAGGPLVAAILLARIGHIGPLVWFMPPAANMALREIGIVLFLAVVGLMSGDRFVETLVHGDGLLWIGCGVLVTLIPLLVVGFIARAFARQNYLTICGLLSGSMTDPPALAFANAMSASEAPALAYATVYPMVMFLRILAPQLIVLFLW